MRKQKNKYRLFLSEPDFIEHGISVVDQYFGLVSLVIYAQHNGEASK